MSKQYRRYAPFILPWMLAAGCAMGPGTTQARREPIDRALLTARIEALLDYVEDLAPAPSGVSTPAPHEAPDAMRARHAEVSALLLEGVLAENNRGYLRLWEAAQSLGAARRNSVQQVLAAENRDRKTVFREFTERQADSRVTVTMIEGLWLERRMLRAEPGHCFQLPEAGAAYERFRNGSAGKRFGAAAAPGAWVELP